MPPAASPKARYVAALERVSPERFRTTLRELIAANGGNVAAAARELEMSRRQLWRWIARHPAVLAKTGHVARATPTTRRG